MKVRINRQQFTAAQKQALKKECINEFNKLLETYNREAALQIFHVLHFDFNFGQKRLKRFADKLKSMQIRIVERYEVEDKDIPTICELQLKDAGIDIMELLK